MFDTHAVIKRLQESGFSEQQAETMAGVLQDTQKMSFEHLATKRDIQDLQRDLKGVCFILHLYRTLEHNWVEGPTTSGTGGAETVADAGSGFRRWR